MRVYIATSFKNKEGFNNLKDLLEAAGHTITHDWSKDDASKYKDGPEKELYLMDCAIKSIGGICQAEAVVLLAAPDMAGAFVEMGLAIGAGVSVIVLDAFKEGNRDCIFYRLPGSGLFQHIRNTDDLLSVLSHPKSKNPLELLPTTAGAN